MMEYIEMESLCHSFLVNSEHRSRRDHTEQILMQMYDWLKKRYGETPPDLGVSVSESIGTKDGMK